MAGNMAWKAGKGAIHKFSGKNSHQDPTVMSVDHSHYRGAKVKWRKEDGGRVLFLDTAHIAKDHRKDSAYYEYLGIPKKDAKTLSHVVSCARFLDNGISVPVIGYRIGVSSIVGLIPEFGDFVGGALSFLLIIRPASCISNRSDADAKALKHAVWKNWTKGCLIGVVPLIGDLIDTHYKFNVRSADALEKMLLKRANKAAVMGRDAEKVGRATGYQRAGANGHHHTLTNGHHNSDSSTHPPRRFIGDNDLRQDPSLAATARAPGVQTQMKEGLGTFFRRRGGPRGGQQAGATMEEEVAPGRPPRPEHSNYEHGGQF